MDTFSRDGLTFDVTDSGPRDAPDDEIVVLLHGFPQDRHCWDDVRARLDAAGLRTLAPDQRGYSPGARPREVSSYRVGELVRDVLALLDAAGVRRAHVVGHDWGGGVAWALAAAHPERVASLTAVSTPHPDAMNAAMLRGQALRSWYVGVFQLPDLPERVLAPRLGRVLARGGLPAEHVARYAARFALPESLRGPVNWYRAMLRPGGARDAARGTAVDEGRARADDGPGGRGLGVVGVPTTFVWGRTDPYLGRAAAVATSEFVGQRYRFVEVDAGHWLPETRADVVADAVLARVRSGGGDPGEEGRAGGGAADGADSSAGTSAATVAMPVGADPSAHPALDRLGADPDVDRLGADPNIDRLGAAQFVALTTYRRSAEGVTTPMWVGRDGAELVFTTPSGTGKVTRLRRDPRVRLQISDRRGRVRTGALAASGRARLADGAVEVARGEGVLRATYGWQYGAMLRAEALLKRGRRERTIIRVTLD